MGTPPPGPTLLGGEFAGGSGTASDPYRISNVHELQNMSLNLSAHYVLVNDIDASMTVDWNSGAGFAPVGTYANGFTGSLDGMNHTITDLIINRSDTNYTGLFGFVDVRGSVKNVGLEKFDVIGRRYVGGLAGNTKGTVSNTRVMGNVDGDISVGGLVGGNKGTVTDCLASGNVTGRYSTGGLVGYNDYNGKVYGSRATCCVAGDDRVGGLVGLNDYVVSDSQAVGSVTGNTSVGGLVGESRQGRIVSSSCTAGVVVGNGEGVGGLVGYNFWATVESSHATVDVEGTSGGVGGLVGWSYICTVSDSYSTGDVSGEEYLGGLIGWIDDGGTVSRSYATGNVSGTDIIAGGFVGYNHHGTLVDSYARGNVIRSSGPGILLGGFVGFNDGDVSRCYSTGKVAYEGTSDPTDKGFAGGDSGTFELTGNFWDNQTSQQTGTSGNATGRNTTQMMTSSTFADEGWDLSNVWCMLESLTYPLLRWQDGEPPRADAGPDQTVDEGTLVTFDGSASSDNVGVVGYTWTFTDGAPVTLSGEEVTHRFENAGTFVVTLNVTDAAGNWATATMTVTVLNVPDPPIIIPPELPPATEDVPYTFDLDALDPDAGDSLTWSMSTMAGWLRLNATTGELSGTPTNDDVGDAYLDITVTDSTGRTASLGLKILVLNVNDPPVITTVDVTTASEDEPYRVFYAATDVDAGEVLTWSFERNASWLSFDPRTGVLSGLPTNEDVGAYYVNLTVSDVAGAKAVHNFTLTVLNVNDAPVVTTILPTLVEAREDEAFLLDLAAEDVDDAVLIWSDDTDLFDIGPANGTIRFLPTQAEVGVWWANVTVTDGGGLSDTVTIWLVVRNVNDAPVITSLEPATGSTFEHDTLITLSAQAEDVDGDELTLTWRDGDRILGIGLSLDVRFAPGEHRIVLTVEDGIEEVEGSTVILVLEKKDTPGPNILLSLLIIVIIIVIIVLMMAWYSRWRKR